MSWYHDTTLTLAQAAEGPPPSSVQPGAGNGAAPVDGTTAAPGTPGAQPGQQQGEGGMGLMMMMVLMIVVFWVLIILPQRREKRKQSDLMSSLKKGDKLQTIGGIRGTLIEVRGDEVVLKIDENNNTRMRFSLSAVQAKVGPEKDGKGKSASDDDDKSDEKSDDEKQHDPKSEK